MGPLKTKPPLFDKLFVRVDSVLRAGNRYLVELRGLRTVGRVPGDVQSVLILEAERPRAAVDSAARDTTRRPP
jgi:hypothetical protein